MRIILLFSSLLVFININLIGQENHLNQDSLDIEQLIISATRASKNDPVTIQNIRIDQIEAIYAGQDPAVLLQQLSPSIISYSDAGTNIGNYAQFRMRGISQSRINVSLNGVPLNDMVDQGVYFSNFSDFGNSIESIQVQRGVGASNAGVSSYGGAVNFESANIFKSAKNSNLEVTTGSFGTLRTSAELSTGLMKNSVGAYARISRTNVKGYKLHSASDSYSMFGSIGFAGNKDVWKLTGFMGKTNNDQSYLPVLLSDIKNDPRSNYNHPNDADDFEQELLQLQYSRSLGEKTMLDATMYYGGARGIFPFSIDDQTQYVYGLSNDHYGIMSHINHENNSLQFKSGIQAYYFGRTNFEYVSPDVSHPYDRDRTKKTEFSAFSKLNYKLGQWSFFGNIQLRATGLNMSPDKVLGTGFSLDENWLFLNWVGGLNYNLNKTNSLYISIGKTGREPTRSDIRGGVTEEEYVTDIEMGWRYQGSRWNISANMFHMKFTNEISQVGALMERSYMDIRQNVPDSRRSGIELELYFKTWKKYSLSLNGAYMNSNVQEFDNGDQIFSNVNHIFTPRWVVRPQINIQQFKKLGIIFSGRYVSASYMELANIPSFQLPAHTIFNAQINLKPTKNVDVSLMLNNLFNQQYFTDGAPVDFDYDGLVEGPGFRVEPPRHFYVKLKIGL